MTVLQLKAMATEYGRITQASANVLKKFAFLSHHRLEYMVVCCVLFLPADYFAIKGI